jgi:hypothetical protein
MTRDTFLIVGVGAVFLAGAALKDNLAAEYVAIFGTWLAYAVHSLEVRIEKRIG